MPDQYVQDKRDSSCDCKREIVSRLSYFMQSWDAPVYLRLQRSQNPLVEFDPEHFLCSFDLCSWVLPSKQKTKKGHMLEVTTGKIRDRYNSGRCVDTQINELFFSHVALFHTSAAHARNCTHMCTYITRNTFRPVPVPHIRHRQHMRVLQVGRVYVFLPSIVCSKVVLSWHFRSHSICISWHNHILHYITQLLPFYCDGLFELFQDSRCEFRKLKLFAELQQLVIFREV
jgi:hypothetical protein